MANNPNDYAGKPLYGKDICSLMRRINAVDPRKHWDAIWQYPAPYGGDGRSGYEKNSWQDGNTLYSYKMAWTRTITYLGYSSPYYNYTITLVVSPLKIILNVVTGEYTIETLPALTFSYAMSRSTYIDPGIRVEGPKRYVVNGNKLMLWEWYSYTTSGGSAVYAQMVVIKEYNLDTGAELHSLVKLPGDNYEKWAPAYEQGGVEGAIIYDDDKYYFVAGDEFHEGDLLPVCLDLHTETVAYINAPSGQTPFRSENFWCARSGVVYFGYGSLYSWIPGSTTANTFSALDGAISYDPIADLFLIEGGSVLGQAKYTVLNPDGTVHSSYDSLSTPCPDYNEPSAAFGTVYGVFLYPFVTSVRYRAQLHDQAQTPWYSYAETEKTYIGTMPEDNALIENGADLASKHLLDMRDVIETLAGIFGLNWINPSPSNLYRLAMGDRTKYGATGGARYTWTRVPEQLIGTPAYDIDIGEIEECVAYLEAL